MKFRHSTLFIGGAALCASAAAQLLPPTHTLVEPMKKVYGRASQDLRNIGLVDYWWVGHDPLERPYKAISAGNYVDTCPDANVDCPSALATEPLEGDPGDNMDRHACGFLHLNGDGKIDMVCSVGADQGHGQGWNEVYRNDSTSSVIRMTRIETTTGIEDKFGRGRAMVPFHYAGGGKGIWSVVQGVEGVDQNPNRLFRYDGDGTFTFTKDERSPAVHRVTSSSCAVAGRLVGGDQRDDLLLCRPDRKDWAEPVDSILYKQDANGIFTEVPLPTASKRFLTAEIADVLGDNRKELIVSVVKELDGGGQEYRIEIYTQNGDTLNVQPKMYFVTTGPVNSLAIGDLDGDGKPDIYAAVANWAECNVEGREPIKFMTDRWPDVVLSTASATGGAVFGAVNMVDPTDSGCSWLATWAGPGIVHLGRGLEGVPGNNYVVDFRPQPAVRSQRAAEKPSVQKPQ